MKNKKVYIWASVLNFFFFLLQTAGYRLDRDPAYHLIVGRVLTAVLISACLAVAVSFLFFSLFNRFHLRLCKKKEPSPHRIERFVNFPILWALFFISYVPFYLIYRPGVCAFDAHIQLSQCVSGNYIDHHPFLHTMLLNCFYRIGVSADNIALGIGLFVLFQMIVLSAAFAASVVLFKKKGISFAWQVILAVFFTIYPYHAFIAGGVAKEALFTAAFVSLVVLISIDLAEGEDSLKPSLRGLAIFLLSFPAVAFRTNARYALMLGCAVLFLMTVFSKRKRKLYGKLFLILGMGVCCSLLTIGALYRHFNVTQADRREMLSVPIQQLARAAYYHYDEFSDEEKTEIDNFILNEAWKLYTPALSDPVKRNVNTNRILVSPGGMLRTYLGLLKRYPGDFVNAVLALDSGYYYLGDKSCLNPYKDDGGESIGFINTLWSLEMEPYLLQPDSLLPRLRDAIDDFNSQNVLQSIPVLRVFFMPALVMWIYLYLGLWALLTKRVHVSAPVALAFAYVCTLLLGPVVAMRYAYPVWALLPLLMAAGSIAKED